MEALPLLREEQAAVRAWERSGARRGQGENEEPQKRELAHGQRTIDLYASR